MTNYTALSNTGSNFQSCIKTVVFVIARSVLCDEAIPRWSSWPEKREIASPENGLQ
jgi:hypothetical protein